jgi:hypothetical protein
MRYIHISATVLAAALLSACQPAGEEPAEGTDPTTSPAAGMPDGCYEERRELVVDPAVAPEGFDLTAEEAIAQLAGRWAGTATDPDGAAHELSFEVAHDGGPVEAVFFEYRSFGGTGSLALGAPSTSSGCENRYSFGVVTSLDAPALLGAEGTGVTDPWGWSPSFTSSTPLEEVTGGLAPSFDPSEWDRVTLEATVQLTGDDAARLEVWWSGAADVAQAAATGTATGTVSTGTVAPSGVSESVLGGDLARAPAR